MADNIVPYAKNPRRLLWSVFGKILCFIEDSLSKFPEVFLTLNATADFTKQYLQKSFSREGIAQVLVTDNGKHFSCQIYKTG